MNKLINKYKSMPVQVKASLWFLLCSFMQKGVTVISTPIFTRLLSTTQYGQYSVFNSWLGILTIFVSMRLYSGVYLQGVVKFSDEVHVFSSSLQGLSLTLTVIWTAVYLAFRGFWNGLLGLTTVQMLAMLVMIWSTSAFNFWATAQRAKYKYRTLVIITAVVSLAKPALGVLLVLRAEDKVTARILGLALVEVIAYTGLFIQQLRKGKVFYSGRFWKYALLFNLPLIPHYLSQTILNSSDRIMISRLVDDNAAGIYNLAYNISQIMTLFNTALTQTMSPWIYSKIKTKQVPDIARIAYLTIGIIEFVNLALIAIAPEAVAVFAPKAYHEAVYVIPPVAMACVFMFSYDLFAKFEFYYEKTRFIMVASVFGAVLNIVLNYIFIRLYGYQAAAYTTLVCYIIYCAAHYLMMNRVCRMNDCPKPYNTAFLLIIYGVFIACGFVMMLTYEHPVIRYSLIAVTFIALALNYKRVRGILSTLANMRKKKA